MTLAQKYTEISAIGYYSLSNWGGLEILDIIYDINDKLVTCFNFGNGREMIRQNTIYTTAAGRSYIRKAGMRFYLDEIIRVN